MKEPSILKDFAVFRDLDWGATRNPKLMGLRGSGLGGKNLRSVWFELLAQDWSVCILGLRV